MGLFDSQSTYDSMEGLLKRERDAILSGHYDQLEKMVAEKEKLGVALGRENIEAQKLAHLREQSERNAILYDAMRAGIGSALDRLRALKDPKPNLQTYDHAGRRTQIVSAVAKTERRP